MLNTSEIIKLQQGFGQEWQKPCESWIFPRQAFYLFWTQVVIQESCVLFSLINIGNKPFFPPKNALQKYSMQR